MGNSKQVFVSPGIYTRETDLTFVSQSVGVSTLGLAGETLKGPAFEPVLITNFDEFRTYFGGTSPEKDNNGNPKYELGYVAKAYLQESNQLFVTRVLGLTGYRTKYSYGLKTIAGITYNQTEIPEEDSATMIPTATGVTGSTIYTELSGKTAVSGLSVPDEIVFNFATYADGDWFTIGVVPTGSTTGLTGEKIEGPIGDYANQNWYNVYYEEGVGLSAYLFVYSSTGNTFNVTKFTYTSATENTYGNMTVAVLRSRGSYTNQTLNLQLTTANNFNISSTTIENNPLGEFFINVTGSTSGSKTFTCSLDTSSSKYITKVLGSNVFDVNQNVCPIYVHESYPNLVKTLYQQGLIRGINLDEVYYNVDTNKDFMTQWKTPESPMVVSEVRGGNVFDLFQIKTVSDGDAANYQVKITIANIDMEQLEFDVLVRDFNDTDDNVVVLEKFGRCSMNPDLTGYIGRRIGTEDGEFELKSKYIYLVLAEDHPTDAVPAGFRGYVTDTLDTTTLGGVTYKTKYFVAGDETGKFNEGTGEPVLVASTDKYKKHTLGLSSSVGYDTDLFKFKGLNADKLTPGFHMSVNAAEITGVTVTGFEFETTPYDLEGNDKGMLDSINFRKFTFAPFGGFDGWDIYRQTRTNTDQYVYGKKTYVSGNTYNNGVFNELIGNSDYYAYLDAINTFANPEAIDINIFATPGINFFDHNSLVTNTIDMIENERADSIYIINSPNVSTVEEVVDMLDEANIDSNYSATYWPWIQIRDNENSSQLYIPPTAEVVRNAALTDNISYPWFAIAGYTRGLVKSIKARKKLTLDERDILYKERINPIATFSDTGAIIFGNKTLQVRESALDRINVRRLLLRTRKLISAVAVRLLFDQNDEQVRNEFLRLVSPILETIKKERGLYDFRITVSNNPEDYDANTLRGKIYIKPTRSLEFVDVEFVITPTGASFDNV